MKCIRCNRLFEPTLEEYRHGDCPPPYCSPECYMDSMDAIKMKRAQKIAYMEKHRWMYHIGEREPLPGSKEARIKEVEYQRRMEESLARKPPRFRHCGFSEYMVVGPLLPSEAIFGQSKTRVCDESSVHLGGEDGEKFNFEGE